MILILILGVMFLNLAWNMIYKKYWAKDLQVHLVFEKEGAYAGEEVGLYEEIQNRKRLFLPILEVGFHTDKELVFQEEENTSVSDYYYKRDIFSVLGQQRILRKVKFQCRKRGHYEINEMDLVTFSMAFSTRYAQKVEVKTAINVYPAWAKIQDLLVTSEQMIGSLQCAKKQYEDPFAFRGIRGYTRTDPMGRINWKTTARVGELMVNTYDSVRSQRVMIYLDVSEPAMSWSKKIVEEEISIAATLTRKLIRDQMEVGLSINVPEKEQSVLPWRLEPQNGASQLAKIEERLMEVQSSEAAIKFEEILQKVPKGCLVFFLTCNAKEKVQQAMQDCVREERMGIWVFCHAPHEEPDVQTKGNVHLNLREVL